MLKRKKNICAHPECKKRISLVDMLSSKCKCDKVFCILHRLPESHKCTFDYTKEYDREKEISKMKCVSEYDKI